MQYVCDRCQKQWPARLDVPRICPQCKTPYSKGFIRPADPQTPKVRQADILKRAKDALEREVQPHAAVLRALFPEQ